MTNIWPKATMVVTINPRLPHRAELHSALTATQGHVFFLESAVFPPTSSAFSP